MTSLLGRLAVAAACLGLVAATPTPAEACGGFFCSQVPIDQSSENIVFTIKGGTVTATIQILYTGSAEDFAWVVPVSTQPEIGIGPQDLFTQLKSRTDPQFYLDIQGDACNFPYGGWLEDDFNSAPTDGAGGVDVLAEEEVGPYETVVLASSDSHALWTWLDDNGFDQPEDSIPLIDHYLSQGMLFVALKLKNDSTSGDIQPVTLTFSEPEACVPLILTKIAAQPDMPVRVYLLGDQRAIPTNWFHVEINQKKIDWLNFGSNYNDVLTQAVNEAAGHGFVTEFAGGTADMNLGQALYWDGRFDLDALKALSDPAAFVQEMLSQGFPRDSVTQALLRKHIPMPQTLIDQGLDERDFYNNLEQYAEWTASLTFDPVAFADELDERVVEPLRFAQEQLDTTSYLTRMYTTVSPDEMTRDPLFDFNPDLPDVSNVHTAMGTVICDETGTTAEQIEITLENGESFVLDGPFDWNMPPVDPVPEEPAAAKIELIGKTGPGMIVDPNQAGSVDGQLDTQDPEQVLANLANGVGLPPVPGGTGPGDGPGCEAASPTAAPIALLLVLLGLVAIRRRA